MQCYLKTEKTETKKVAEEFSNFFMNVGLNLAKKFQIVQAHLIVF